MEYKHFWNIISSGKNANTCEEANSIITEKLESISIEELVAYEKIFRKLYAKLYNWNLWDAAYIIEGGCGDDAFMDFRASTISLGKEFYKIAILNPDMLNLEERILKERLYNEEFQNIAATVYEKRTSKVLHTEHNFQEESNEPFGDKIDYESADLEGILRRKYPNLMKEYW